MSILNILAISIALNLTTNLIYAIIIVIKIIDVVHTIMQMENLLR